MKNGPAVDHQSSRSHSVWIWGLLAAVALIWPSHLTGPLDGAPLDRPFEALLLGLVFPAVWFLRPAFLSTPLARGAVVALLVAKVAATLLAQEGLCVRFEPPVPIVRNSTGRPHSWDLRADWRSPNPGCSALMTHGWDEFKQFPVWFYNLPPVEDNWPSANDRPPYVALPMSATGFIAASSAGVFDVVIGPGMDLNVVVNGQQGQAADAMTRRVSLDAGTHFVQISGTLTGNQWRLTPRWNGEPIGSTTPAVFTLTAPTSLDVWARAVLKWLVFALVMTLLVGWMRSATASWNHAPTLVWTIVTTVVLATVAWRGRPNVLASPIALWSVTALATSLVLPVPERLRSVRGAFLLLGVPWLAWVAAGFYDNIGRFSFYTGGEDSWTYQRYAYSIFLQGNWLQGGSATFYFQPLYRWTIGALHMIFGDSSIGEFYADAAALLVAALFAYRVASHVAGYRWGLAAAVLTLTLVMQGPTLGFVGRGLTDISSMGLIYLGALIALTRPPHQSVRLATILAAGVLATLGFYTRLNNLPLALAIATMAIPLDVRAGDLWNPARVTNRISWTLVVGIAATLSVGVILFAWRTWYYTGVFSVIHGTSFGMNSVWQPGLPVSAAFERMRDSVLVMLTLNDPPRISIYSMPLLIAAGASVLALMGVKRFRELPLAIVLFFAAGCSSALAVRGIAYSGRYSTHLLGSACAIATLVVAIAMNRARRGESLDSSDRRQV